VTESSYTHKEADDRELLILDQPVDLCSLQQGAETGAPDEILDSKGLFICSFGGEKSHVAQVKCVR